MRKIIHIIAVLTLVSLCSGLGLVSIYKYATPLIAENQQRETKEGVFKVFPEGKKYEKLKTFKNDVFLVKDKRDSKK